jgi:hypothetical protein
VAPYDVKASTSGEVWASAGGALAPRLARHIFPSHLYTSPSHPSLPPSAGGLDPLRLAIRSRLTFLSACPRSFPLRCAATVLYNLQVRSAFGPTFRDSPRPRNNLRADGRRDLATFVCSCPRESLCGKSGSRSVACLWWQGAPSSLLDGRPSGSLGLSTAMGA